MISRYLFVTPVNFATVARKSQLGDHLSHLSGSSARTVCGPGSCGRKWDRVVIPEEVPQEGFSVGSSFPEGDETPLTYNPGAGIPPVGDYQIPGAGGRGDVRRVQGPRTSKNKFSDGEQGCTGNEILKSPIKKTYEGEIFKQRRFSKNPQMGTLLSDGDLEYCYIDEEDGDRVIQHLRDNFFADEPLNKSVQLVSRGESNLQLEKQSLKTISDGMSIMALHKPTQQIAGVILSGVVHPGDFEHELEALQCLEDSKYRTIFEFIYRRSVDLDLFNRYQTERIFECRILSVDKNFRSQGIAKKLFNLCLEVAIKNNFIVLKTDCTGQYSQKIAKSHGFEPVCEVSYEDYTDESGVQVFNTDPPHTTFQITIKLIQDPTSGH